MTGCRQVDGLNSDPFSMEEMIPLYWQVTLFWNLDSGLCEMYRRDCIRARLLAGTGQLIPVDPSPSGTAVERDSLTLEWSQNPTRQATPYLPISH